MSHGQDLFNRKKVTIMGLGLLGRGVGDAEYLARKGARVIVTDKKNRIELADSLKKLKKYRNIKYTLSRHKLGDFRKRDFILKAAGVPLDSPYIKEARKNKIPIEMDASLFVKLAPKEIITIGVTGTKGKSTTTHLIHHILKEGKKKVHLGGNVRGLATLPLLEKIKPGDIVLMELDSWQLQGFGDSEISPNISVFTNLMRDHMNYYGGDMNKYFRDKANIFRFQSSSDYIIAGTQIYRLAREKKIRIKSKKIITKKNLEKGYKTKLIGTHNIGSINSAISVGRLLGVSEMKLIKLVSSFVAVHGRLEFIKKVGGVSFYNDTTSTMPDATIIAIDSLTSIYRGRRVILIAGGSDKNLDYKKMVQEINKNVRTLILFPGTGTDKILKLISKKGEFDIYKVRGMKEAVALSYSLAKSGDAVLLSPGAASFGTFNNEFDRGDQFNKYVKRLND